MKARSTLGVHWGGNALRVWAISQDGTVVETAEEPLGLSIGKTEGYEATFLRGTAALRERHPGAPILLTGMAGAKGSWMEAPYARCPLRPSSLLRLALRFDIAGHSARLLPGAAFKDARGNWDVMRGEEVQLIGALELLKIKDAVVSIPGKHCKIASLEGGVFTEFHSYITGELFELLSEHSLVGALRQPGEFSSDAFSEGVLHGAESPLATAVFACRANTLQGDLAASQVESFLSGVLIGAEAAQLKGNGQAPVVLMASGVLAERYAAAFDALGIAHKPINAKAAMGAGLAALVRSDAEIMAAE